MEIYTVTVDSDGTTEWYKDSDRKTLHREDGPAVKLTNGYKAYYINGELHRMDGPAVEHPDGSKEYYINGELHREDGPAFEDADGFKEYYINGKRHREDGPAFEYPNGSKEYYLNGEHITEKEHLQRVKESSCEGKIVEIDGKKYKLSEV